MAGQKRAAGIAARTISGSVLLLFSNLHNGHSDMQCDSRKEMKKKKRQTVLSLPNEQHRACLHQKRGLSVTTFFFSSRCCAFSVVGAVYSHATSFFRSSSSYPASRFDGLVLCVPAPAFFFLFFFFRPDSVFFPQLTEFVVGERKREEKQPRVTLFSQPPSP